MLAKGNTPIIWPLRAKLHVPLAAQQNPKSRASLIAPVVPVTRPWRVAKTQPKVVHAQLPLQATGATQTLLPGLVTNSETFYAATVTPGTVTLTPTLAANSNTVYAPTVSSSNTLSPSLVTNSSDFFTPTVTPGTATLAPTIVANSETFYDAVVTGGAAPSVVGSTGGSGGGGGGIGGRSDRMRLRSEIAEYSFDASHEEQDLEEMSEIINLWKKAA